MTPHPLDGLWNEAFRPTNEVDMMDVTVRALRGQVMKHRAMTVRPITQTEARSFIAFVHRHAPTLTGWKYGTSIWDEVGIIGCVAVGRPVAGYHDDGHTLEINRCALMANAPRNAATTLIGRACRVASELGYTKVITYTLEHENGGSLRAAGFEPVARSVGGSRDRPSRPRPDEEYDQGPKVRWERVLQ